jgi:hypothetical protein
MADGAVPEEDFPKRGRKDVSKREGPGLERIKEIQHDDDNAELDEDGKNSEDNAEVGNL